MINKKRVIAIYFIILGLCIQPILAQEVGENSTAENITPIVHTLNITPIIPAFAGGQCSTLTAIKAIIVSEQCSKGLKGNLIIIENEGKNKNITVSFINLIEENSSQVLDKSKINISSGVLNEDQSKYTVNLNLSGYGVWVSEMSINTTGIKPGNYDGKVIIEGANSTPLNLDLSVKLAPPLLPKELILIIAALLIILALWVIIKSEDKDPAKGIMYSIFPIVGGAILLYLSPLSDPTGNTLLNVAFFVPLAAFIIDFLKGRRDDRLTLEKSVIDGKKTAIDEAIKFHSALSEELNAHAATFSYIENVGTDHLVDVNGAKGLDAKAWNDGKETAVMVSELPGYRLARYYQYTDDFNNYLGAIKKGETSLKNPTKFKDFCQKFENFNRVFNDLEHILYLNLYYNIGSFQYRFRSFKEFDVPFHLPRGLIKYFTKDLNIAEDKIKDYTIYDEKIAIELTKKIEEDFKKSYQKLQEALRELSEIHLLKS